MIVLVNFSDERMTKSQQVCSQSAMRNGVDIVWPQNPDTITREFREMNKDIFCHDRGYGYWLWKPYFIYKSLLQLNDGDILIYADAGVEFIDSVQHIISRMDQDVFLFSNGHQHVHWCKGDVLEILGGNDVKHQQVQASVIFAKVNDNTRRFFKTWLLCCQIPGFIDDSPSAVGNHPEFAEHRHDQAILTSLAIAADLKLHWWPDKLWYESQAYRWPDDTYPAILKHHRKRNNEYV